MITFGELPATAETTTVSPEVFGFLAYGPEDRSINAVAEACATVVFANAANLVEIMAIGDKVARTLGERSHAINPSGDQSCFIHRYAATVAYLNSWHAV